MNFKRTPTVIFLCVLPLLIALGLWQLGRADQKRVLLEQREQGMSSAEILSLSDGIVDNVDVLKFKKQNGLKIVGVGYTLYLGNKYEGKMLKEAAQLIFEAHQAGLTTLLWIYPRAKGINEENIHTIAGAAGVAAVLDTDFAKLKYPYSTKDKKKTALNYLEVTQAAGRTKIICVGGEKKTIPSMLEELKNQLNFGKTSGLAIGRNLHQRSLEEASRFANNLGDIIFKK